MTDKEIQKIAEFCGFKFIKRNEWPDLWILPNEIYPGGESLWDLPNFTESMDAILKWVVPKLGCANFKITYDPVIYADQYQLTLGNDKSTTYTLNQSLPMAFCEALEKYIDAQTSP